VIPSCDHHLPAPNRGTSWEQILCPEYLAPLISASLGVSAEAGRLKHSPGLARSDSSGAKACQETALPPSVGPKAPPLSTADTPATPVSAGPKALLTAYAACCHPAPQDVQLLIAVNVLKFSK
jgi:hypothetical protein